jgi:hypothetical protein
MVSRFAGDFMAHGDAFHSLPLGKLGAASHTGMLQEGIAQRGVIGHYLYTTAFWPGVAFLSLTPVIAVFALLGWLRSVREREHLHLILLFGVTFLMYVYLSTIGQSMATFARFSITFTLFLIPFAAAQWARWSSVKSLRTRGIVHAAAVGSLVGCFALWTVIGIEGKGSVVRDKISSISPVSRLPVYLNELIDWLDQHAGPNDKILIDDYRSESAFVRMYSGLKDENLKTRWRDEEEVVDFLEKEQPRFIVWANHGRMGLTRELRTSLEAGSVHGFDVLEVYANRTYRVCAKAASAGATGAAR